MILDSIFQSFLADSPACVMTRAILEHGLSGAQVDALFDRTAQFQYTRELLFSSVVEVIGRVVFRQSGSVGSAYQELKSKGRLGVSSTAVYDKLNRLEPAISAERNPSPYASSTTTETMPHEMPSIDSAARNQW